MNQPQTTPAPAEPQETTVRIDIKIKMGANLANLTTLVEKTKPLIATARELGDVDAQALFGRQKLPIA